nr:efflux RND transporter periplasmic adaptor subunit [Bacteroidales bacterium]
MEFLFLKKLSGYGLAVLFLSGLSACKEQPALPFRHNKTEAPQPIPVRVLTAETSSVVRQTAYVGNVAPAKSAVLTAPYPGTLKNVSVREGDPVKTEQTVAEIFSQSVNSRYDAAAATLKRARDSYNRAAQVHRSGSISDAKMVEAETAFKQAAAIEKAAAQTLRDGRLKAPFDGVIDEIMTDEGVELTLGQPVLRILDLSAVEIRFPVPEKEIGRWQAGDSVHIIVPALDDRLFQACVTTTGLSASAVSHTYLCTARLADPTTELKPGMVCKVYDRRLSDSGFVIPTELVERDTQGTYLWVVEN